MSVEVGFSFYKKIDEYEKDGKKYAVLQPFAIDGDDNFMCVYGRCEATSAFCNAVKYNDCPEKGFHYEALVTHSELEDYVADDKKVEYEKYGYSRSILKYRPLKEIESFFDFDEERKAHSEWLDSIQNRIMNKKEKIENLRVHQERAQTEAAFNGFQKQIEKLEEEITKTQDYLEEAEEEDYDYKHFLWTQDMIEKTKKIIEKSPDVVVTAWGG